MSTRAVRAPWLARASAAARSNAAATLALRAAVGSRLIVWSVGVTTLAIFGRDAMAISRFDASRSTEPFHSALANLLVAPGARWDSAWYLGIVHDGYATQQSTAFFPLYPLLVRAGAALTGSALPAGILISVGSLTAALYLLHRLTRLDLGDRAANTAVLLLAFFPTAFFLSAVYSESLFLMLSLGAVYAARRENWKGAGLLGCAAALSRPNGVLVALALGLIYLYGPRAAPPRERPGGRLSPRYPLTRQAAWLSLTGLGVLAYLAYAGVVWHDPLAPFAAQAEFGREFGGVFGGVLRGVGLAPVDLFHVLTSTTTPSTTWDPLSSNLHHLIDLSFLGFGAAGLALARSRLPPAYLIYSLAMLASSTSYPSPLEPLEAMPRYTLVLFPAFMGWAAFLSERPARARIGIAGSAVLLAAFSGLWAIWAWLA